MWKHHSTQEPFQQQMGSCGVSAKGSSPGQPTKMGLIQLPQNKSPRTEHASWKVPSGSCSRSEEGSAYFQAAKTNLMLKVWLK